MSGLERIRRTIAGACALALPIFALLEVNYPRLSPQAQLAVFALLGLTLAYLRPRPDLEERPAALARRTAADLLLAAATVAVFGYVVVQSEPLLSALWSGGRSLGDRAGIETGLDIAVGVIGLLLLLEATRRMVGPALPILALVFLAYAGFGASLPDWLMPHRGYDLDRIVAQTFLHSQGVFGVALRVMFTYVFLFVVFGALLEATGATGFIVEMGRRLFGRLTGGPAKVAVFSSGLLGSLSGSAVANTATTGTFTIPMMRNAGFRPAVAAGIEAAASAGGALVPPVMGAGAYMMLELVEPQVTYLEIIRAALLPALLYYFSIFMLVHFTAQGLGGAGTVAAGDAEAETGGVVRWEGAVVLAGMGVLLAFLISGFTVFRAVSVALIAVLVSSSLHPRTRVSARRFVAALSKSSRNGIPLIGAAACVGVVIGVVTLTGVGTRLPALILPLAQDHLLSALLVIMVSSIVLGMGLPSAVCYLLMATLIGPVLGKLGVVPLAAHLFIFYFGLMSMVTPPVALAAYAASSISGSRFLETSVAAFRFALVGFTLPFMFVFRPQLLMLDPSGSVAGVGEIVLAVALSALGLVALAGVLAGRLRGPIAWGSRTALLVAAALLLYPGGSGLLGDLGLSWANLAGLALFFAILGRRPRPEPSEGDPVDSTIGEDSSR